MIVGQTGGSRCEAALISASAPDAFECFEAQTEERQCFEVTNDPRNRTCCPLRDHWRNVRAVILIVITALGAVIFNDRQLGGISHITLLLIWFCFSQLWKIKGSSTCNGCVIIIIISRFRFGEDIGGWMTVVPIKYFAMARPQWYLLSFNYGTGRERTKVDWTL